MLCLGAAACARQGAPPGGPEDRRPPVVVATQPGNLETLTDLGGSVRFLFDERISERVTGGALETAVSISPRGGDLRVDHDSRAISVHVEGGFQAGLVYRVTLDAVVSDLFGNSLSDPFELVFSTGGEPVPTTLAGEVWNRVSGEPAADVTVFAVDADGLIHQARTDRDGIFAFRYLPGSAFTVTAFEDLNRNSEVDSMEVQGGLPAELSVGDTLLVDIPILAPDTSAAVVGGAEAVDSVTVAVEFDDFLDPEVPADSITVSLSREAGASPGVARMFDAAGYAEYVSTVSDSLAVLDSIDAEAAGRAAADLRALADTAPAADSLAPPLDSLAVDLDSVGPPADTAVISEDPVAALPTRRRPPTRLDPLQGSRAGRTPDGRRLLPGRRIVLLLDAPLERGIEYEVELSEAVNIVGLGGGGGTAAFTLPVPDSTAVPDSIAGEDTLDGAAALDTGVVDTLLVDTVSVPDTGVVDTFSVPDTDAVDTHVRREGGS